MTMPKRIGLALAGVGLAALALGLAAVWSWRELNRPLNLPAAGIFYEVRAGAALATVTGELADRGVVSHPRVLDGYARLSGAATGIHAGEYRLLPGLTPLTLLDRFQRGEVFQHQFTIVEGWRFDEMLERLRAHPAIAAGSASGAEVMAALGEPERHPEGQFLPDTYSFARGTRDLELLRRAHEALDSALSAAWLERTEAGVLSDPYAGLILASIIEKETALGSERGIISGVFHGRLMAGMRLQTDPTVIYGLGPDYDGNLTRAHLNQDTPYNTYTRPGLPPTPIALPGRAAIAAAFSPAPTEALYFVATGDPDGSHVFSRTLEEHNAAVRRYVARGQAGN
jgi:UPF0755 protein